MSMSKLLAWHPGGGGGRGVPQEIKTKQLIGQEKNIFFSSSLPSWITPGFF